MDAQSDRLAEAATVAPATLTMPDVKEDPIAQLWMRMAGLRFQLSDCVSVQAVDYRGRRSYLLRNAFDRQQYRLSQGIYQLLAKMDGRLSLAQICEKPLENVKHVSAVQREIITTLTQLQAAGLLIVDVNRELGTLIAQRQGQRQSKRKARWMRLLSPRIALVDPDRFLIRVFPAIAWLFRPWVLALWLGVALLAGLLALMHWDALATYGAQRLDDPQQWILLVCLYPLVKGLHELGHCLAVKSGGAAVNEMGITLLVFLPVPYVDASAASSFASKNRRMLVGAAGIMVEVFLSSLALFTWLLCGDGMVRDMVFAVMVIGGVSTLLFNGNPLLRFDGYYILADAVEIPNLASRSARYYAYLTRRYLLGVPCESPHTNVGERRWFLFYGAASTIYRYSITIGIALFLIATVPVLGTVMAAWLLSIQLILPLGRQLHYLLFNPALSGRRVRAFCAVVGILGTLFIMLALMPFPSSTNVEGIVMLPERSVVRAEVDGFLQQQNMPDEAFVVQGDVLFVLSNPQLDTQTAVLAARLQELNARRDMLRMDERAAREIHTERLAQTRQELADLQERQAGLSVRSPGEGALHVPFSDDRMGRFVRQGDMLAYLTNNEDAVVRVVATQQDASRIRENVEHIEVRLADGTASTLSGQLLGEAPLASDKLPSAALGSQAGGLIPVDSRDEHGITALQRVFAFDITIPHSPHANNVGSRASVRFEHQASPLLPRWYDSLRKMLINKIGL